MDADAARQAGILTNIPVAVLIGPGTGSGGKIVAVALEGRTHTRFFGRATSASGEYEVGYALPDGGRLTVQKGWVADRLGRIYKGSILPDAEADNNPDAITNAIDWLRETNHRSTN
jgi:C-terminal processing protease CtpA/Prc